MSFLKFSILFIVASMAMISCSKDSDGATGEYTGDLIALTGFTGSGKISANLDGNLLDLNVSFNGINPALAAYAIEENNGIKRIQNIGANPSSPFNAKINLADSSVVLLNSGKFGVEILTTGGAISVRGFLKK
ncbi:MAG TPA: hypothetical protein PK209_11985 [Saprospiraceae bacterium]|nr:hypothetical protein [Candidatus Vicinibacter affinis]HQX45270.1 hypothetical protein [Saprospiraceae bacterium]